MSAFFVANFLFALGALCVLASKRSWLLAAVALFCVVVYGYGLLFHGVPSAESLQYMLYCEERCTPEKAMASSYGAIVSLMMTSLMMSTYPWLKRWSLFIWFALLLAIGVVTGAMSPLGVFEGLYGICCAIMTFLAQMLGMTYLEACCLENIYLHSLLPTLFAIPAVCVGVRNLASGGANSLFAAFASLINFLLCLAVTVVVWSHYLPLSMLKAAQLCCVELKQMGLCLLDDAWSGYVLVNMIIFVGLFLLSAFVSWLLYRWNVWREGLQVVE